MKYLHNNPDLFPLASRQELFDVFIAPLVEEVDRSKKLAQEDDARSAIEECRHFFRISKFSRFKKCLKCGVTIKEE